MDPGNGPGDILHLIPPRDVRQQPIIDDRCSHTARGEETPDVSIHIGASHPQALVDLLREAIADTDRAQVGEVQQQEPAIVGVLEDHREHAGLGLVEREGLAQQQRTERAHGGAELDAELSR